MAVALGDLGVAVDLGHTASLGEHGAIGAETHGAAEIAARAAPLQLVAAHPFGQQADDRLFAGPKFGRPGILDADEIACRLDHGHLHAKADAEVRNLARACKARRQDLALRATLTEPAGHEDAVHAFQIGHRVLALEDL